MRLCCSSPPCCWWTTGCAAFSDDAAADGKVTVAAAFYPLAFVAQRVGGDDVARHQPDPAGQRAARPGARHQDDRRGRGRRPGAARARVPAGRRRRRRRGGRGRRARRGRRGRPQGLDRGRRREGPALLAGPGADGDADRVGRGVAVEARPGHTRRRTTPTRRPWSPTSTSSGRDYEAGAAGLRSGTRSSCRTTRSPTSTGSA